MLLKTKELTPSLTSSPLTGKGGGAILPTVRSSMEQTLSHPKVRFGAFEADLMTCELRKNGLRLKLSEQPFQVLAVLLEKPGDVVSREQLRNRLWPRDTFGDFDHGLNNAVMRLREVLGDSSDSPCFIETLPRRGYRFIAPVEELGAAAREAHEREVSNGHPAKTARPPEEIVPPRLTSPGGVSGNYWLALPRILILSLALLLGVIVLTGITAHYRNGVIASKDKAKTPTSLVVLPLENLSGDKEQDFFADGMTDDLIANLAKIRSLRVISRSTAMAYKGARKPLSEIARELNVDAVVEGTVLRSGDRVRITAELVQVSTDRHLWADTYESQIGDVLALQNRVSSAIVDEIRINLTPEEKERLAKNPAVSPQAYENYLKGRYYWNKRSDEGLTKAISYFEEATREDPQYALAYAGLADAYAIIGAKIFGTMPASAAAPKAKAAALQALQLDTTLAEAHTSLATIRFNYDWDWPAAASGFKRAIELNPNYATAYQRYSLYLMAMGQTRESFEQINRARTLDPLSISINFSLGWRYYLARQYNKAVEQLNNTLEMDPSYELPHLVLGQVYAQRHDFDHAIPELQRAAALAHNTPLMISALANAYAISGRKVEAEKLLAQLLADSEHQYVSPYYVAVVYAGLGNKDRAMEWLERSFSDHSNGLVFLKVDPELDALRGDARFQALQRQVGFPNPD
jgi:TolB-like protein/DNA-binding winged helix-turn-helix (wHTH) protein/Tfp pilus assembly protein PilF